MVSFDKQLSLPSSLCIWISQIWERAPKCTGRAVAVTIPVDIERM